jgi:hypothetical protein
MKRTLILSLVFASFGNSYAQDKDLTKKDAIEFIKQNIDTLRKFNKQFKSGDYSNLNSFRNIQSDIEKDYLDLVPELASSIDSTKWNWKIAAMNRNTMIQEMYVENGELTHFAYARMNVEGKPSNVINANIVMNFFVLPKHWRVGAVVNGKFRMRMFTDQPSAPIRTPSNMAGITFFTNTSPNFDSRTNIENRKRINTYYKIFSASIMHHSNGQDSSSYNPDGSIDLRTGNFGVNFWELAYMVGRRDTASGFNNFARLGFQHDYIIDDFSEENQKKQLEGQYGQDRINFQVSFSRKKDFKTKKDKQKERERPVRNTRKSTKNEHLVSLKEAYKNYWRFVIEGSWVLETNGVQFEKLNQAINIEAKYYWKIPYTPNFMFMGSFGWLGHDYYNIYFEESTFILRAGIAASLSIGAGTSIK